MGAAIGSKDGWRCEEGARVMLPAARGVPLPIGRQTQPDQLCSARKQVRAKRRDKRSLQSSRKPDSASLSQPSAWVNLGSGSPNERNVGAAAQCEHAFPRRCTPQRRPAASRGERLVASASMPSAGTACGRLRSCSSTPKTPDTPILTEARANHGTSAAVVPLQALLDGRLN